MTDKTAAAIAQLKEGVATLTNSENWKRFLDVQAKFHNYSWGNCMLIAMQNREATRVAGFHKWNELGRHVRKGEHGIQILAPMIKKLESEDGDKEKAERRVFGFKVVFVFDVEQTEGEELPAAPVKMLTGDDDRGLFGRISTAAQASGFSVAVTTPSRGNGDYTFATRAIRVRPEMAPIQQVKTLIHEFAHGLLHTEASMADLAQTELEAESVAYVVSSALGIDTSDYSFGYIAIWAKDAARIERSAERIQKAAHTILAAFEATGVDAPAARPSTFADSLPVWAVAA